MQAEQMTFTKLIEADQGAREHFHVPKYQREYTWRMAEAEQLLNDIEENSAGYFMGSVICVMDKNDEPYGGERIYEVVDGQQRLTTLSLLLAAVFSNLQKANNEYAPEDPQDKDDVNSTLANLRAKLVKRKKDENKNELGAFKIGKNLYFLRVQPSAQNHNLEDYKFLLSEAGVIPEQKKPAYCGNRQLSRTYNHFESRIPNVLEDLVNLVEKINQLMFVLIRVGTQADAFTLFESLNNRGIPLSAMDIIKNKMLAQMERKHGVDIDESYDKWQTIVSNIPEAKDQERFLRQYYNAFKHKEAVKVTKVNRATRSVIIKIYENLINKDASTIFDDLSIKAKTYGELLNSSHKSAQISEGLLELERIGSVPAYTVLLFLFSLPKENFEKNDFLANATDLFVKYFIRRNVTDTPPTRQLDQAMIDLIESCAKTISKGKTLSFPIFSKKLNRHAKPASLTLFKESLADDIYYYNTWMTRFVLIQLDKLHHSREYEPNFWLRDDKNRYVWTVEHVLPQTENLPAHWIKMIANGNKTKALDIQEEHVHRLGNLTLSGYNSSLSTSKFDKKQALAKNKKFLGHKINIGYKNGLALNKLEFKVGREKHSLADAPHWDAKMIEARTEAMVAMIADANLLPGE